MLGPVLLLESPWLAGGRGDPSCSGFLSSGAEYLLDLLFVHCAGGLVHSPVSEPVSQTKKSPFFSLCFSLVLVIFLSSLKYPS